MKPKRLSLQEITKLYQLLKPAIDGREQEKVLLDEVDKVIELASPEALLECLYILYDNNIRFNNVAEFNVLFIAGLLKNEFFFFIDFIRGLNGIARS